MASEMRTGTTATRTELVSLSEALIARRKHPGVNER
jgi:hypothetical protein